MKKVFLLLFLIAFYHAKAQVALVPQLTGLSQFSDLWNVSLINTSSGSLSGYLTVTVTLQNNDAVVTLQTPSFLLSQGVNQVPMVAENTATSQFASNTYGTFLQTNNSFLTEAYNVCYDFNILTDPASTIQQCVELNGASLAPISLFSPYNGEEIHTLNPDLVWIPPYPSAGLTYNLLLVPYDSSASFSDNFVLNSPFFYASNLTGNDLLFQPVNGNELETGQSYLWKVQVVNANVITGETDSWVFKIAENASNNDTIEDCYRILKTDLNNGRYLFGKHLLFAYDNRSNDDTLNLVLNNISTGSSNYSFNTINLSRGLNKINIDIANLGLTEQNDYMLVITDSDQKTYNFIFRTDN